MVVPSIIGYLAGVATKVATKVADTVTDKITGGGSSRERPAMPESVAKSVGAQHPVTGKYLGERTSSAYHKNTTPESYAQRVYNAALLIPLILGAAWMAYLVVGSKAKPAEVQLSPATNSLVASLFVFIIVYSIFLAFFFWNRTRALKAKETKKIIKRPRKKR